MSLKVKYSALLKAGWQIESFATAVKCLILFSGIAKGKQHPQHTMRVPQRNLRHSHDTEPQNMLDIS